MRVSKDKFDLNSGAMSLLRIHYGIILLAHGWLKIFVFTLEGTAAYFSSIGLSPMFAYFVSVGELVGGIALILGVQTRLAAFLSIPIVLPANGSKGLRLTSFLSKTKPLLYRPCLINGRRFKSLYIV